MKLNQELFDKINDNPNILNDYQIEDIAKIIDYANESYYNDGDSPFTDDMFELIKEKLEDKDPNHPMLDNPGARPTKNSVKLPYYMPSIEKKKKDTGAINRWFEKYPDQYVISDKLDGAAALYISENGKITLYKKGDGVNGFDISHILPYLSIPHVEENCAVRGELVITKKKFSRYFVEEGYKTVVNAVSSLINKNDPDIELLRHVDFVAHECIKPKLKPSDQMQQLKSYGFTTVHYVVITDGDIEAISRILEERKEESPYNIDGIIVNHDEIHKRVKENKPKYLFALKSVLASDGLQTTVISVEWTEQKDKILYPVVVYSPIKIDNMVLTRANGKNARFIKNNIIGSGSSILVVRGGHVIPDIRNVLTPSASNKPQFPDIEYVWNKTGVHIIAVKDSDQNILKQLEHFFIKCNVKNIGAGTLQKLYDEGYNTVSKILNITYEELLEIPTFKDKSATKILENLQKVYRASVIELMVASNAWGSNNMGPKKLQTILEAYPKIVTHKKMYSAEKLVKIPGIQMRTAEAFNVGIVKFWKFLDTHNLQCPKLECKDDDNNGNDETKDNAEDDMKNLSVLFTGFRNSDLEQYITQHGGTIKSTLTSKVNVLIIKDDTIDNTKVDKARKMNIEIITCDDFVNRYNVQL